MITVALRCAAVAGGLVVAYSMGRIDGTNASIKKLQVLLKNMQEKINTTTDEALERQRDSLLESIAAVENRTGIYANYSENECEFAFTTLWSLLQSCIAQREAVQSAVETETL